MKTKIDVNINKIARKIQMKSIIPSILFFNQFLCCSFSMCKYSAPTFPQYISMRAVASSFTVHRVDPEMWRTEMSGENVDRKEREEKRCERK